MEWRKTIHNGNWEVSDTGLVRRVNPPRMCKLTKTGKRFCVGVAGKSYPVSRLVAESFIPNPENKSEVHHIDRNPSNNNVDNLMWVTYEEHWNIHGKPKWWKGIKNNISYPV